MVGAVERGPQAADRPVAAHLADDDRALAGRVVERLGEQVGLVVGGYGIGALCLVSGPIEPVWDAINYSSMLFFLWLLARGKKTWG